MITAIKNNLGAIFLIATATVTALFFFGLALSTIVDWRPDASGLPPDIAAIQASN
ncbi:MAG: hypothetical protein V4632_17650 [Pseudomonadota bacterium]